MFSENHSPKTLFRKFQHGGNLGIFLGGWFPIASTILRHGLSTNELLSANLVKRIVVGAVVGFILAGAWEVLLEVILRRNGYNRTAREEFFIPFKVILVEGGVRFGLPLGLYIAFATTFAKVGISSDPFLWLSFLFALAFCLPAFFLVGCVFGFFMLGASKLLGLRPSGASTESDP